MRLAIGLDPGVTTGVALWDIDGKRFTDVGSSGIVLAMRLVETAHNVGSLHVVVFEDARLRTWFGAKGRESLQGAGSIKRDCQIWAEWLALLGCPYKAVSPQSKGAKLDAKMFARITGWTGRTNEHARDAAALVLGWKAP